MCGIVGIIAKEKFSVRDDLIRSLQRLEYRGYDSCGFATFEKRRGKRGQATFSKGVKSGPAFSLRVRNLDARRDWGYSADYVKAMWLMLQQDTPEDYVIAIGETHSVRDPCEIAFGHVGLDWNDYVVVDEKFYKPSEVFELRGDANKAKRKLRWEPTVSFEEMIKMMVDGDMRRLKGQEAM